LFEEIYDLERIVAKITFESANGRDLIALKNSIKTIPLIKIKLENSDKNPLKELSNLIDPLEDLFTILENSINEEPPFTVREGGIIKDSYNQELDDLRIITRDGKKWITSLESKEREKTGIKKS
jgi:DNA mismatch repair protein MutS